MRWYDLLLVVEKFWFLVVGVDRKLGNVNKYYGLGDNISIMRWN